MDVRRDNRVLSLVNRAGLKGTLSQMLDQLQRCQKSLNEFLEVIDKILFFCWHCLQKRKFDVDLYWRAATKVDRTKLWSYIVHFILVFILILSKYRACE